MAAYRRVYDSRHPQADCQEPGSAAEPYARQSSMGYRYLLLRVSDETPERQVARRRSTHADPNHSATNQHMTVPSSVQAHLSRPGSHVADTDYQLSFFTAARRYASTATSDGPVSVSVSVCLRGVVLKSAGTPETRLRQRFLNNLGLHTCCTNFYLTLCFSK